MSRGLLRIATLIAIIVAIACASPSGRSDAPQPDSSAEATSNARTLVFVIRSEPLDLTDSASAMNSISLALFGADLVDFDEQDRPYPVLADAAPELNTDAWRLLPDGTMETSYHLRSGLVWHDGVPLTSDDFVFAQRLNAARFEWGLSVSSISPIEHRTIAEVLAPDPQTVLIRWKQPYAPAIAPALRPYPKHILQATLDQGQADALGSHPYWTTEHVGLGPYRMTHWEQGAFIEGAAFDRFALGQARIPRVRLTWSGDPNATVARLLGGEAHVAIDRAIYAQETSTLRQEWVSRGAGVIVSSPGWIRFLSAQSRPAYANPAAILDVRVRRATAHVFDRAAIAEAMLGEGAMPADIIVPPSAALHDAVDRVAMKYPYDLRRTEQLLGEAGFTKGTDGVYVSPTEGRYAPDVLGIAEGDEGRETTIVADYLRKAGVDAQLRLVPSALIEQSDELKATYPAWRTNQTSPNANLGAERMIGSRVATPENRWSGTNKMGWSNPEHDALFEAWSRSLNRDERNAIAVQIAKLTSEELPYIPLYFTPDVVAHTSNLVGPIPRGLETTRHANVYAWHWK